MLIAFFPVCCLIVPFLSRRQSSSYGLNPALCFQYGAKPDTGLWSNSAINRKVPLVINSLGMNKSKQATVHLGICVINLNECFF